MKEPALDYPERYEAPERITVESSPQALATDGQLALLDMLGAPELARRRRGRRPGRRLTASWLSEPTAEWRGGCARWARPSMPRTNRWPTR
jgi:hypothetical protein